MYKEFFGLLRIPFQNTPDPDFYFDSRSHREALARMVYGIDEGKGFILVTGDVGAGKTMLVQALKRELEGRHILIEIANPWVTPEEVEGAIRQRVDVRAADDSATLEGLKQRLATLADAGTRVVLIIDEAHQLPERTLEGIRLLSNMETSKEKLLLIVLLGQDELASMLSRYSMRQVQQRIALSYHLQRFNEKETTEYIQHRLRVAGATPLLFPEESIRLIHQESLGSPRVINQLCDNCLLFAFGRRSAQVTPDIVHESISHVRFDVANPQPRDDGAVERQQQATSRTAGPGAGAAGSASPAPAAAAEVMANSAESRLPFALPGMEQGERAHAVPPAGPSRSTGIGLRHLMLVLAMGLVIGALGLWYMQTRGLALVLTGNADAGARTAEAGLPSSTQRQPWREPAQAQPTAPIPKAALASVALTAADASARDADAGMETFQMPLPGTREGIIPRGGLSMLGSNQYGAWNETVRDLISAVNPGLSDLESLPAGTKLQLPTVSRESLVVRDTKGNFHVYYGSFDDPADAQLSLEAIGRLWSGARLVPGKRDDVATQRLFIGSFATQAEALAVANSMWFKHLPVLN